MAIENIQNEEQRKFAEDALADGWNVEYDGAFLKLRDHKVHSDITVYWKTGGELWQLRKDDQFNNVPAGKLSYPSSIFF